MLMCNNAMTYNSPETLYYHTAKNLLSVGLKIITKVSSCLCLVLISCECYFTTGIVCAS